MVSIDTTKKLFDLSLGEFIKVVAAIVDDRLEVKLEEKLDAILDAIGLDFIEVKSELNQHDYRLTRLENRVL